MHFAGFKSFTVRSGIALALHKSTASSEFHANRQKLCSYCVVSQRFRIRKLDEISVFWYFMQLIFPIRLLQGNYSSNLVTRVVWNFTG